MSRFLELYSDAESLEDGPLKVSLCEELIREADLNGTLEEQFEARELMVHAGIFSGAEATAIVAFAWCLGQSDKDPQRFPPEKLLWSYKWIVNNAYAIPTISRAQIVGLFEDAKRRYREAGQSLRPLLDCESHWEAHRGNLELARQLSEQAFQLPRDGNADCIACEHSSQILACLSCHQFERAAELADQAIARRMSCGEEPERQMSYASLAYKAIGRHEDSRQCYLKWYPKVRKNPNFILSVTCHLSCLVRDGDFAAALPLFERHVPWAVSASSQSQAFRFYLTSYHLFAEMEAAGEREATVRVSPEVISWGHETGTFQTAALKEWAFGEASRVGQKFDERNGTPFFHTLLSGPWPWGF